MISGNQGNQEQNELMFNTITGNRGRHLNQRPSFHIESQGKKPWLTVFLEFLMKSNLLYCPQKQETELDAA